MRSWAWGTFLERVAWPANRCAWQRSRPLTDCSIVRIEKADTVRVLHDEPAFSEMFLHYLLSRNIRIEEDLVDHLFNSSEKRLARVLLLLANFGKEGKPETVIPKISQETLAEIIGTTRSQSQLLHEQVPQAGLHQLQRPPGSSQLTVERRPARLIPAIIRPPPRIITVELYSEMVSI